MHRRRLLAGLSIGLASLSGCVSARRSIRLTFDSIPPELPDECTTGSFGIRFPGTYDDDSVDAFVRQYEQELQASLVDRELSLSFEVTITSGGPTTSQISACAVMSNTTRLTMSASDW
jgi:hypothetical protein